MDSPNQGANGNMDSASHQNVSEGNTTGPENPSHGDMGPTDEGNMDPTGHGHGHMNPIGQDPNGHGHGNMNPTDQDPNGHSHGSMNPADHGNAHGGMDHGSPTMNHGDHLSGGHNVSWMATVHCLVPRCTQHTK